MGLFSRGQKDSPGVMAQVLALGSQVEELRSEVRTLRAELALTSDMVTKRMRRAVAAERAVERNQEREGDEAPPTVTPAPPARLSSVRMRRLLRARGQEVEQHANGA